MEDRAVLGDVYALAVPHGVDPFPKTGAPRYRGQEADGLGGEAVLGVVEVQVGGVEGQGGAPGRVVGEQVPQVGVRQHVAVLAQGLPLGCGRDGHWSDVHERSLADGRATRRRRLVGRSWAAAG